MFVFKLYVIQNLYYIVLKYTVIYGMMGEKEKISGQFVTPKIYIIQGAVSGHSSGGLTFGSGSNRVKFFCF